MLLAAAFPLSGAESQVAVVVEIDGSALLAPPTTTETGVETGAGAAPPAAGLEGEIDLAVLQDGTRISGLQQPFVLGPERLQALARTAGLKLFAQLPLAPGTYRLQAVVRAQGLPELTSGPRDITVPDFSGAPLALTPPLLPDPPHRWTAFRTSLETAGQELPYPFVLPSGEAFLPAARPVLPPGVAALFHLFAHGLGSELPTLQGSVSGADGAPIQGPEIAFVSRQPFASGNASDLVVRLEPGSLAPGSYRLTLRVTDPESEDSRTVALPFRVAVLPPPGVATGAPGQAATPGVTVGATPPAGQPGAPSFSGLDAGPGYRRALEELARRGLEAGVAALVRFEPTAVPSADPRGLEALRQRELAEASRLAARSAGALVPLLALHAHAFDRYLDRGDHGFATHSRLLLEQLAHLFVDTRSTATTRRLAGDTLAILPGSGPALRAALEVDPGNEIALLELALEAEKSGRFSEALGWLKRLSATGEDLPEGRLRTAVQLRRLGRYREARETLEPLLDEGTDPDLLELAYQELASLALARKDAAAARRSLQQGIARVPESQRLRLRLAFLDERAGDPRAAASLVDSLVDGPFDTGESPRYHYTRGPVERVEAARSALDNAAGGTLPALEAALAGTAGVDR